MSAGLVALRVFPHGAQVGNANASKNKADSTVHSVSETDPQMAEWCLGYGFHERTVRRWYVLLEDEKLDHACPPNAGPSAVGVPGHVP